MRLSFALPFGLFLFALFYTAFTLSLDTERMVGDTFGYDPGSRLVPLLACGILGFAMLVEMVRARTSAQSDVCSDATGLVLINIAISVGFIAAFRYLGYLPATTAALFLLIAFNLRSVGTGWTAAVFLQGLALTLVYGVAIYSALRGVVHLCFTLARQMQLPHFREPALQASLATVVLVLMLVLGHRLLGRRRALGDIWMPAQISVGVTMTVFVIFRLIFLVQLPRGIVWW